MEKLSVTRQSWLSWIFRGILVFFVLISFTRLFELQIIKGGYYKRLSEGNRIRSIPIPAPRGKILAREGEVLVGNSEKKVGIVFDSFEGYKEVDPKDGEFEITKYKRNYRLGSMLGHVTGYLGEVNEDEVGKINPNCPEKGVLKLGQLVGRDGLEQMYECELSGVDGAELIEVDSMGKKVRTLGKKDPIPGKDIKTTIHFALQKKVAESFGDQRGAVVITNTDGEVLALYSSPSYDPNVFVDGEKKDDLNSLFQNKDKPFFDRAMGGLFQPGSIFKPIVAIAGLEEGVIDRNYTYNDKGYIEVKTDYGDFRYNNWFYTQNGGTEGEIGLKKAIARSTDTFFYDLGGKLGADNLVKWAKQFGLDKKTGIDLPGEIPGLVPSPDWKRRIKGERWFLGNTYHFAIGQGDLLVTPLSINSAIEAIASGGRYCAPYLVNSNGCKDLKVKKENLDLVTEGMKMACQTGGTGFPFFDSKETVSCKTGTAETGKKDTTHAWFTMFTPSQNPEIVGTFLVEEGGEGSSVAAPIAKKVYDFWYGVNKHP